MPLLLIMAVKKNSESVKLIHHKTIANKIFLIRDKKVLLDKDLAMLYRVETRVLNQAVKRNIERFPADFMFQLSKQEMENWMSQIVISNKEKMGIRKNPYAFTQEGVAMLSSVLNSKSAIEVNIEIMRAFVQLREIMANHADLRKKIEQLENKYDAHDSQIKIIFEAIKQLFEPQKKAKKRIGF